MSMKLVLLVGLLVASWTVDAAAIQNSANLSIEQTNRESAETIVETAPETTAEGKAVETTVETMAETTVETTEEMTEETTRPTTTEEEKTEETIERSSQNTENDPTPSAESKEQPVQFKHFVDVESVRSEMPPPPFGVNPNFHRNEELPHFQPQQQESTMQFVLNPNLVDVQQGMHVQQEFFHGIDGMLRPVIRQGRESSNHFSSQSRDQSKKPFREDPIGDDKPSMHLMSSMQPEFQQTPATTHLHRVPFIYPHDIPVSKPMIHFNSMPNEILQSPQMHMVMPVTVDTDMGPMVFFMQVPSSSLAMQNF